MFRSELENAFEEEWDDGTGDPILDGVIADINARTAADLEKLRAWNAGEPRRVPPLVAPSYPEPQWEERKRCQVCSCELEWVDCYNCDDGEVDGYEEDPLWFDPGDTYPCDTCNGKGGWLECPNAENHERKETA